MKYCINLILGEAFFVHVFIFFHLQDSGRSVLTSNLISIFDGMKVKTENSIIKLVTNQIIIWTPGQKDTPKMLHVIINTCILYNGMEVPISITEISFCVKGKQRIYLHFSSLTLKYQNFQICLLQS